MLSFYLGGKDGASVSPQFIKEHYERLKRGISEAFPGTVLTGEFLTTEWTRNHYIGGSCTSFGLNQRLLFDDIRPLHKDSVQWAGEHVGGNFVCYMEGAVRSGEKAAESILSLLRR